MWIFRKLEMDPRCDKWEVGYLIQGEFRGQLVVTSQKAAYCTVNYLNGGTGAMPVL